MAPRISVPIAIIAVILVIVIGGYLALTGKNSAPLRQPVVEKSGPAGPAPAQPVPQDETTNWETYRNEEYGFEVRYPASLHITGNSPYISQSGTQPNNNGGIDLSSNQGNVVSITVYPVGTVRGDYTWPERPCGEWTFSPDDKPLMTEHILFASNKTLHVVSRGFSDSPTNQINHYYCINHPQHPLVIFFSQAQQIFAQQILSTFKFIK